MARTFAFFMGPLAIALVITAAGAELSALAIGSAFVRTFEVALYLVGGVLLIFGAGAMTFQITWSGLADNGTAHPSRPDSRSAPSRNEGVSHAASTSLPCVWPPSKEERCAHQPAPGSSKRSLLPS